MIVHPILAFLFLAILSLNTVALLLLVRKVSKLQRGLAVVYRVYRTKNKVRQQPISFKI